MRETEHTNKAVSDAEVPQRRPLYTLRPVTAPAPARSHDGEDAQVDGASPFLRPASEDDDGYDPYSDRPADPDPPFQQDPWR